MATEAVTQAQLGRRGFIGAVLVALTGCRRRPAARLHLDSLPPVPGTYLPLRTEFVRLGQLASQGDRAAAQALPGHARSMLQASATEATC